MLSLYYQWSPGQRRQIRLDYQDDLNGGRIPVRTKNGDYRMENFGGFVSIRDISGRDWKRVKLMISFVDSLPEIDLKPIPSGHILGVYFGGKAYVVLTTDEELVVPVEGPSATDTLAGAGSK